ncbi:hypothetical protein, partial [Rhizobium leguminosarum]|uniref:hypothetical protein n=1 Tax=Rhizobium leguminosarum TaxID=384 RepID=UPI003F94FF88
RADGAPTPELRALAPVGDRLIGANPPANGGLLRRELDVPDIREYAVDIGKHGSAMVQSTEIIGNYLRDPMKRNAKAANF